MPADDVPILPVWAPRLKRQQIRRFYETCSAGIFDANVIDDVGYSLYARCMSMLEVGLARRGRLHCPACDEIVTRTRMDHPDEELVCSHCRWTCSWRNYRDSYKGKSLFPGRMESIIADFVRTFRSAKEHRERIVLIDTLIHSIHAELVGGHKPAAYQFIEGATEDIAAFLNALTYGDGIPDGIRRRREQWRERIRSGPSFWSDQTAEKSGQGTS